jgi:acetyl esterase/lipase
VASVRSRLAPLVVRLRGSKHRFRSAARTLAAIERQRLSPPSFTPPASIEKAVEVERHEANGWPVYRLSPRGSSPDSVVIFLHGGCYVFEIEATHWRFLAKLAVEANVAVVVPIMPLAPRATASDVVPRVADLAESLIGDFGSSAVSIAGDSSGGGMALAVAMELRDRGQAPLHGILLSAPWLDVSGTDPLIRDLDRSDPWLATPGTRAAAGLYRGELGEGDWRVSPIHGDLTGLAPILDFSGTRDILHADALRLVACARESGVPLEHRIGRDMIHNFPILPMPEGDAARAVIVDRLRRPRGA